MLIEHITYAYKPESDNIMLTLSPVNFTLNPKENLQQQKANP